MCPNCREPMLALELDGIEIDRCDRCGGMWFDRGEMTLLLERTGEANDVLHDVLERSVHDRRSDLRCPRCGTRLHWCDAFETVLGRCRWHGLWCDASALASLVDHGRVRSRLVEFIGRVCPPEPHLTDS